ncbi:MAG TPA: phospholipase C, phosphocholine-specific [Caulobacteraceae bacterium]|jgi:phospholipase C|nr:phospholipase C, phosphocholine-specific [Caulobacteraceae bacterium]
MTTADRRRFLKLAAAAGALASPATIARALAIAPARRTGTIMDVEHVVILMQENRSFDHYFGAMRGVRGFDDPRPIDLPSGKPVWYQAKDVATPPVLPFRLDTTRTNAEHLASLDHSWKGSHAKWKDHDAWIAVKGPMTMGHFTREDLPFYYALADAFTVCDAYHCSIFGPTSPNRNFLFTGTSGLSAGYDGPLVVKNAPDEPNEAADPALDAPAFKPLSWTTYAERLQAAGVSWKVYQEYDNYGDNALAFFKAYRGADANPMLMAKGRGCVEGSTKDNAKASRGEHLIAALKRDVETKSLPQVSWIVAPYIACEHPSACPSTGERLTAGLIDAITSDPETWSKTVFILNYDENDGFFDHVPPPLPPTGSALGKSTVATDDETWSGQPVGLGPRVPALVVSPWSRGGWVTSEVFDHTSVIRFLERRFGVNEPNISAWRRTVCGDLTSAFDFAGDVQAPAALPDTSHYLERADQSANLPPPALPDQPALPRQELGQRPSRATGYDLAVESRVNRAAKTLVLDLINNGRTGACFDVRSTAQPEQGPWFYTVEAGKRLSDTLPVDRAYHLAVRGPNGFLYEAAGRLDGADLIAILEKDPKLRSVQIEAHNPSDRVQTITLASVPYRIPPALQPLRPHTKVFMGLDAAANGHWYDVKVGCAEDPSFLRRFAGRLETGKPGVSDPAIGRKV